MKAKDLKDVLQDIIDTQGPEAEVLVETPRGTIFTPNPDEGWYEADSEEDNDLPADGVIIPLKVVGGE